MCVRLIFSSCQTKDLNQSCMKILLSIIRIVSCVCVAEPFARLQYNKLLPICKTPKHAHTHTRCKLSELFTQTRAQNESDSRAWQQCQTMIFKMSTLKNYDFQTQTNNRKMDVVRPKRLNASFRVVTLKNHKTNRSASFQSKSLRALLSSDVWCHG